MRPVATAYGWPRWLRAREVEAQVIHPNSIAVSREHCQAKTDRLDPPAPAGHPSPNGEEALIPELRRSLALPLDDIREAMRRCVRPNLSRSGIHGCLQRHGLSTRLTPHQAPAAAFHTDAPAGFIHVDVKYLPPLNRRRSYAYVAIDRGSCFVYLEILADR